MNTKPSPIIDVLSADSFAAEHIPGAVNFCVYETAFLDKVSDAFPDKGQALTLYGFSEKTEEAATALSLLQNVGYSNVTVLAGGLEGWKAKGHSVEGAGAHRKPVSGRFEVDTESSFVRWTGSNLLNFHTGTLKLGKGYISIKDDAVIKGEFNVDMASLHCSDLSDSGLNAMLINHLRSSDFFSVDENLTAKFVLSEAAKIETIPGQPNYTFRGNFTLRGKTNPLEIPALVSEKNEGGFVAQAFITLDRTLWGSVYGSGKFFSRLGQHLVSDHIQLHLKVVTQSTSS